MQLLQEKAKLVQANFQKQVDFSKVEQVVKGGTAMNIGVKGKHYLNPLHIYCRIRDLGVRKKTAKKICGAYERKIFNRFIIRR